MVYVRTKSGADWKVEVDANEKKFVMTRSSGPSVEFKNGFPFKGNVLRINEHGGLTLEQDGEFQVQTSAVQNFY